MPSWGADRFGNKKRQGNCSPAFSFAEANYFFISSFFASFFVVFLLVLFFFSLLLSPFFISSFLSIGAPACDAARAKPLDSANTAATRIEISFLMLFLSVKLRIRL